VHTENHDGSRLDSYVLSALNEQAAAAVTYTPLTTTGNLCKKVISISHKRSVLQNVINTTLNKTTQFTN